MEFDSLLPLQQSAAYAAAVQACGARARWVDLGCGSALAVERGRLRLVSRGPVWQGNPSVPDRRQALRRLARWPGITLVTPEDPMAGFGLIPLVTPVHHAIWALRGDLRAGLTGKWRNRLGAAERAGVRVRRGDSGTLARLIECEAGQRAAKGYRALPEGYFRALPPACLWLWEWRHGGAMAAAMAFVVQGQTASYQLGWGSDAARAAGVHGVMLMQAAETFAAEGLHWLDLGSVDTLGAPGLARFKLGTGAQLRQLGATLLVLP